LIKERVEQIDNFYILLVKADEKLNTYKFADYKEQVIDLLQRVCTVSVRTMNIITQIAGAN